MARIGRRWREIQARALAEGAAAIEERELQLSSEHTVTVTVDEYHQDVCVTL